MNRAEKKETFERYFEQYKKTEGDESSWSAVWFMPAEDGRSLEVNMTKCPEGVSFKVWLDQQKLGEIEGWDGFFERMEELTADHPGVYDEDEFFEGMKDMI